MSQLSMYNAVDALPRFAAMTETEAAEPLTDAHPAIELLENLDPDSLTPREALDLIYKLKDRI